MARDDRSTLHVTLLNTADHGGGAETVVRLLRDSLRAQGHRTELRVGRHRGANDAGQTLAVPHDPTAPGTAERYARKGFFNLGLPGSDAFCQSLVDTGTNLVHLHNLHGHYLSMTTVPQLARQVPLVWTFHDFFPFTGGCAFPFTCDRWRATCGDCPELGHYPIVTKYDRTRRMQAIKRNLFRDMPVTIVTPSQHLLKAARASGVFPHADFEIIPYGVNTELFRPDRTTARGTLDLPADAPVVAVIAQGLDDPRKGVEHAVSALRRVSTPGLTVLLVGDGEPEPIQHALPTFEVRSMGYLSEPEAIARCYQAADVLLFTSLAENFPCVVQEAMSCGTAVVGFEIDALREQISDGQTGRLVPVGDSTKLAEATAELLQETESAASIGRAARQHAVAHWGRDRFIDRHIALYRQVLDRAHTPKTVPLTTVGV